MDNNYYVYCLVNRDWCEIFYIGKGSGTRFKDTSNRNPHVKAILDTYDCESRIILDNLTEDQAYFLEDELKTQLKSCGKPIIDYEPKTVKRNQRRGIETAKQAGKKLGRPALTFPNNWNEVYVSWKAGEITAKKAMELTGTKRTSFYKLVKQCEDINDIQLKRGEIT